MEFRTDAFDEFEGQWIENHVDWFVGAEYHPQVDNQTQRLGQEFGYGVNKTSGTNAAAVAVDSVTNLIRKKNAFAYRNKPRRRRFSLVSFVLLSSEKSSATVWEARLR